MTGKVFGSLREKTAVWFKWDTVVNQVDDLSEDLSGSPPSRRGLLSDLAQFPAVVFHLLRREIVITGCIVYRMFVNGKRALSRNLKCFKLGCDDHDR